MYFGEHSGDKSWEEIEERHHSYLMSVKDTENDAKSSLLYSYKHTINGFAAVLTQQQASKLSGEFRSLQQVLRLGMCLLFK